jgi:hypothetical protein
MFLRQNAYVVKFLSLYQYTILAFLLILNPYIFKNPKFLNLSHSLVLDPPLHPHVSNICISLHSCCTHQNNLPIIIQDFIHIIFSNLMFLVIYNPQILSKVPIKFNILQLTIFLYQYQVILFHL